MNKGTKLASIPAAAALITGGLFLTAPMAANAADGDSCGAPSAGTGKTSNAATYESAPSNSNSSSTSSSSSSSTAVWHGWAEEDDDSLVGLNEGDDSRVVDVTDSLDSVLTEFLNGGLVHTEDGLVNVDAPLVDTGNIASNNQTPVVSGNDTPVTAPVTAPVASGNDTSTGDADINSWVNDTVDSTLDGVDSTVDGLLGLGR